MILVTTALSAACGSTIPQVDTRRLAVVPFDKKLEMYRAEHEHDVAAARADDVQRAATLAETAAERADTEAERARERLDAEEGILDATRASNDANRIRDQEARTRTAKRARDLTEARAELREAEHELATARADNATLEEQAADARVQHTRVSLLRRYAPRRVPDDASDIEELHADLQEELRSARADEQELVQGVATQKRRVDSLAGQGREGEGGTEATGQRRAAASSDDD
jgi:hypothetical protein